ncbi:MAG: CAP domain-containing protein, partial [Ilumatobacter sp.]
ALSSLVSAGSALAATEPISDPSTAVERADRIGNATQTSSPTGPPVTAPPTPAGGVSTEMQQVLDLVNVERTSRGLVPLTFSPELNVAALAHTQRQAADGAIYHTDPRDGSDPGDRISRTGYAFSTWGENVAAGYRSPEAVMSGWMTSSGHCRNILNPAFTELGVGHVTGGATYGQFWTQVFARPLGVPRPPGTYDASWC